MKLIDLTNQKYNKLTVLERVYPEDKSKKHTYWKCKCDCGNYTITSSNHLKTGHTKSCGCSHNNKGKNNPSYKHGKRNTRLFRIWASMKNRCLNKNNPKYKNYGGRGIKICDEWLIDFMSFYKWSIENGYKDDLTLDRRNVNFDYCPENCRWLTLQQQNWNKQNTIKEHIPRDILCILENT